MTDQWPTTPGSIPPTGPSSGPPLAPPAGGVPPGGPPPTLPGGTPPPRGRSPLLVAVAVATVLVLVVGGLTFVLTRDDGGADAAGTRDAPTTTEAPTDDTEAPTTTTVDADLDAVVDELSAYVEDVRGIEFEQPVTVRLLPSDEYEAALLATFDDEDRDDLVIQGRAYQALGLISPDTDAAELLTVVLREGTIGYYDPETEDLVVRGEDLDPFVKSTMVHELAHALDDQWFDLDRDDELADVRDETPFGLSSVTEGVASEVGGRYEAEMTPDERDAFDKAQTAYFRDADLPPSLDLVAVEAFLRLPYEYGEVFAESLIETSGMAAIADAFADVPATSKEVIDPQLYLEGFDAREVADPPAEGEELDRGMFGQITFLVLLSALFGEDDAQALVDPWLGDQYVLWDDDGRSCIRVDTAVADDGADDFVAALDEWATTSPDAEVTETADGLVRLTSCSPEPAGGGGAETPT